MFSELGVLNIKEIELFLFIFETPVKSFATTIYRVCDCTLQKND